MPVRSVRFPMGNAPLKSPREQEGSACQSRWSLVIPRAAKVVNFTACSPDRRLSARDIFCRIHPALRTGLQDFRPFGPHGVMVPSGLTGSWFLRASRGHGSFGPHGVMVPSGLTGSWFLRASRGHGSFRASRGHGSFGPHGVMVPSGLTGSWFLRASRGHGSFGPHGVMVPLDLTGSWFLRASRGHGSFGAHRVTFAKTPSRIWAAGALRSHFVNPIRPSGRLWRGRGPNCGGGRRRSRFCRSRRSSACRWRDAIFCSCSRLCGSPSF
jgi:hypothetical protein